MKVIVEKFVSRCHTKIPSVEQVANAMASGQWKQLTAAACEKRRALDTRKLARESARGGEHFAHDARFSAFSRKVLVVNPAIGFFEAGAQ